MTAHGRHQSRCDSRYDIPKNLLSGNSLLKLKHLRLPGLLEANSGPSEVQFPYPKSEQCAGQRECTFRNPKACCNRRAPSDKIRSDH